MSVSSLNKGGEELSFKEDDESGAIESAPLGAGSFPTSFKGPRVTRRRAPLVRAALLVGILLSALTLIHVCMRPRRSRAAVKKAGVVRRRLAEGGGSAGDNEEDDFIQALIDDCLGLADDYGMQPTTDSSPKETGHGGGPFTGWGPSSSQGAVTSEGAAAGPSSYSWTPASDYSPPGSSPSVHFEVSPDSSTASSHSWGKPPAADDAALLSALEPEAWLDQIPVLNPQLESGSWLQYIPSIDLQPPHPQGAHAAWGPSLAEGIFPSTASSSFPPFISAGPPPVLDPSHAAAPTYPQMHETPQAAGPPTAPAELPRTSGGPRAGAAEQAEGEGPSTSGQQDSLKNLLQRTVPRGRLKHPFVQLPTVHPASIPRAFNPDAPLHPAHHNLSLPSLLVALHELYSLSTLTSRQVEEMLSTLESLVHFSKFTVRFNFTHLYASGVASRLSLYVLILDSVVAAREILGDHMQFKLWFDKFAKIFKPDFIYQATKAKFTHQATFYWKLVGRLRAALRIYKKGVRPPEKDIILYKRMIFCSSMSPPSFIHRDYEPWRSDDRSYREAAREPFNSEDDEFGIYDKTDDEEEEDED
ncbi:hypothetical protein Emed_001611 [Eimeria media]